MAVTENDDFGFQTSTSHDSSWVREIEPVIAYCERHWELDIGFELHPGLTAYAVRARRRDGTPVVLKLREPNDHAFLEVNALHCFDGYGAIRLIDADMDHGALLLELAEPGTSLRTAIRQGRDLDVDGVAVSLMQSLWAAMPNERVRRLEVEAERWASNLERLSRERPLGRVMLDDTVKQLRVLSDTQDSWSVMLHANLTLDNVLEHGDSWVAISPKGLLGEREFDAAWWLRDPPAPEAGDLRQIIRRRLDVLVEMTGVDRDRTIAWARALNAVLVAARLAADMMWDANRHRKCMPVLSALR